MVDASQSSDRSALHSAIQNVAEAAGLGLEVPLPSVSGVEPDNVLHSDITSTADNLSADSPRGLMQSGVEPQQALLAKDAGSVVPHEPGPQQQKPSCMTFRLDCGLLAYSISPGRIVDPPLDVAPYLGLNKNTFAAQIYWYCTKTSVSLIYELAGQQPSRIASAAQQHPVLTDMLRQVSNFCSYSYILALAEARLDFYRFGYCRADNLAATRDSGLLLRQCVEKEYDAAGRDLEEWSTTSTVARVVEERLQGNERTRLEAAIRNDGSDAVARNFLDAFIHMLWLEGTCFGDGSRWRLPYITEKADWLAQALSCTNLPSASPA